MTPERLVRQKIATEKQRVTWPEARKRAQDMQTRIDAEYDAIREQQSKEHDNG